MTVGPHYTYELVGDRVVAALATSTGGGYGNSAIVDAGSTSILFDSGLTPGAARELSAAAARNTGKSPAVVVNSHWHLDHVLGNASLGNVPVYASLSTRDSMIARRAELSVELTPARLAAGIEELERESRLAGSRSRRDYFADLIHLSSALLGSSEGLRIVPPTHTFTDRLVLAEHPRVELLTFGAAHTDGDTVLFLPDERILFSGDTVMVKRHNRIQDGDPEHWIEVLDALDRLKPERIVPGHGLVAGPEAIADQRDYLQTLLDLSERPSLPSIPGRFADWALAGAFEENWRLLAASRSC